MDKTFDNKRRMIDLNGEEYIDMVIPTVDVAKINGRALLKLNQDDNGRIDKFVWNNVAENFDMIDIVMYANHIFNPFSVMKDELLYVPIDDDSVYVSNAEPSLPDGKKYSSSNSGEKSMTYAERIEYLARKGLGLK